DRPYGAKSRVVAISPAAEGGLIPAAEEAPLPLDARESSTTGENPAPAGI
ncbi:MFS transporter, partial [Streptomyces sp. SID11233]|nr:MFS transporter [Streptomyces sp. SID11233]